jgi:hypothetical protein
VGHDVVEIFEGDESIIIQIGSLDHVFDFLIVGVFSDVPGDLLEFEAGEFTLNKMEKVRLC